MKTETRHIYEGMYVFNGTLSEEGCKKAIERITSSITEKGGEIHKDLPIGRRKLAYEINRMRQGHYYLVYFSVGAQAIKEMWNEYHLNEDLLRYMTLKVDSVPEKVEFKQAKAAS